MIFALAGNQNCGKTTLFNALTGSNQHVGNFPGVTVDQKMGEMRDEKGCSVVDLPGIYSLRPYTQEEIVSRDFIINEKPDGIINIVDATNIERNLYLTLQLLELRVPMVLALNMMDEVRANGGAIDVQKMSDALGIPVVPISAAKGEGVSELVNQALSVARSRALPKVTDFCSDDSAVHRCIHAVVHIIADHADRIGVPARFCAAKLIEGGDDLAQVLDLDENERELLEHCIVQMENETGLDRNAALADMRYTFIESVVAASVVKCHESKEHARSMKIDRILTGKYTAMPTFLLVMLLTFYLTFNVVGKWLSDLLQLGIDALTGVVDAALTAYGINPVVHSLIIDGVFAGVGSVLVFLPIIVTLFFFLSILEDTGYMARVAFVMDKPLRKIGLSGRSIVPMLIGFGCSVPAIIHQHRPWNVAVVFFTVHTDLFRSDESCLESQVQSSHFDHLRIQLVQSAVDILYPFVVRILQHGADVVEGFLRKHISGKFLYKIRQIQQLRQDEWEMLVSFIISQRKSIPAIRRAVELLSERFGERLGSDSEGPVYAFPTAEALCCAGEQALQECGLGYRTRYVLHAAQQAAEGTLDLKKLASLPDEALFARLMELDGVGKKVANCVCLFGYGRVGRVPVDVWIERLIRDEFAGQDPFPQFGLEAGIVQQYLFFYKRSVG